MNLEKNEFAVLGHVNRNWDVFTLQTYSNALAARITTLESTVESLQEQIDALTTALAGKANTGHSH
jgi:chaperonin cofactor prefoldin